MIKNKTTYKLLTNNHSHEYVLNVITRKIDYLFNNQIKAGKTTKHQINCHKAHQEHICNKVNATNCNT